MKGIRDNFTFFTCIRRLAETGIKTTMVYGYGTGYVIQLTDVSTNTVVGIGTDPSRARAAMHNAIRNFDQQGGVKL